MNQRWAEETFIFSPLVEREGQVTRSSGAGTGFQGGSFFLMVCSYLVFEDLRSVR